MMIANHLIRYDRRVYWVIGPSLNSLGGAVSPGPARDARVRDKKVGPCDPNDLADGVMVR